MEFLSFISRLGKTASITFAFVVLLLLCPRATPAQNCTAMKTARETTQCLEEKITRLEKEALPAGAIVMWSGGLSSLPLGWRLCDGKEGRPNLTGRFVVGAGPNGPRLGSVGGSISHDHGATTLPHVLAEHEIPPHSHKLGDGSIDSGSLPKRRGDSGLACFRFSGCSSMRAHSTETDGGRGRGHTHGVAADKHLPPYYSLAYIIKVR